MKNYDSMGLNNCKQWIKIYFRYKIYSNPNPAINIQRKTPCNKGFTPTDFKVLIFNVAPIKNKVTVKPILAIPTIPGAIMAVAGT